MKKTIILCGIAATAILLSMGGNGHFATAQTASDSTVICHRLQIRGAAQYQTQTVHNSTLNQHLAHGDYIGACH